VVMTNPRNTRLRRAAPTDAALLAAVALGDGEACREFVSRHASGVFGLAVMVCGDRSLAEDVAQQAFERAWRHAASFDPSRGSARTWLFTITRRLAIDEFRRRRSSPVAPEDLDLLLGPSRADTEAAGIRGSERERVAAALASLPEAQRRAVVLAAMGGRSATEISAIEHVPVGTAKTRVRLGLRRLRAALAEEADND
jgi:RNA polymerase sigma factor (sigma-70 family)